MRLSVPLALSLLSKSPLLAIARHVRTAVSSQVKPLVDAGAMPNASRVWGVCNDSIPPALKEETGCWPTKVPQDDTAPGFTVDVARKDLGPLGCSAKRMKMPVMPVLQQAIQERHYHMDLFSGGDAFSEKAGVARPRLQGFTAAASTAAVDKGSSKTPQQRKAKTQTKGAGGAGGGSGSGSGGAGGDGGDGGEGSEVKPKRALSAYQIFVKENFHAVKKDLGEGAEFRDIVKQCAVRWKKLKEEKEKGKQKEKEKEEEKQNK